jgi:hypothetical protein
MSATKTDEKTKGSLISKSWEFTRQLYNCYDFLHSLRPMVNEAM